MSKELANLSEKAVYTAHKIAFLANEFPEKSIVEIASMFEVSPIDFNVGAWLAQDEGLITVDDKTGEIKVLETPGVWEFEADPDVSHLVRVIPYVFTKLNADEVDMEEEYFGNWTQGYKAQDVVIAMKMLLAEGELATYDIVNVHDDSGGKEVSTYTFYTLAGNEEHEWGREQFSNKKTLKGKKKRKK